MKCLNIPLCLDISSPPHVRFQPTTMSSSRATRPTVNMFAALDSDSETETVTVQSDSEATLQAKLKEQKATEVRKIRARQRRNQVKDAPLCRFHFKYEVALKTWKETPQRTRGAAPHKPKCVRDIERLGGVTKTHKSVDGRVWSHRHVEIEFGADGEVIDLTRRDDRRVNWMDDDEAEDVIIDETVAASTSSCGHKHESWMEDEEEETCAPAKLWDVVALTTSWGDC